MLLCPVMRKHIKPATAAYGADSWPEHRPTLYFAAIGVSGHKGNTAVTECKSQFEYHMYILSGSWTCGPTSQSQTQWEEEKIILFCIDNILSWSKF